MTTSDLAGEQTRRASAHVIQAAKDREIHSLGLVAQYQPQVSPTIVEDDTLFLPTDCEIRVRNLRISARIAIPGLVDIITPRLSNSLDDALLRKIESTLRFSSRGVESRNIS